MKTLGTIACTAALVLSATIPTTGADGAKKLSLEDCIRIGLERNLELDNAGVDMLMAEERAVTAGAMFEETRATVSGTHTDTSVPSARLPVPGDTTQTEVVAGVAKAFATGTRISVDLGQTHLGSSPFQAFDPTAPSYYSTLTLGFSQSILKNAFGAQDKRLLAIADEGRRVADLVYMRREREIALKIIEAYWNLYAATMGHRTGLGSFGRATRLLETNRKRFEDGLLDETDIIAAEALLATRKVDVLALSDAVHNVRDALGNLIRLQAGETGDWDVTFPTAVKTTTDLLSGITVEHVIMVARQSRADLAALRAVVVQAEQKLAMAKGNTRPDLELFASASAGGDDDDLGASLEMDKNGWTVGLQFEMPLGRVAEKSAVRQAELELRRARNNVAALDDAVELECRVAVRGLLTAIERVAANAEARKLQSRKLSLEQDKFEQGRSATHLLIQYEDDLSQAEMACHSAIASYQTGLARLRVAQGMSPEFRAQSSEVGK